ncbi:hypothetical protein IPM62_03155 [Candidatus Woesebacteria bacterium]|nr:MAG: hypothetical protein IPM62_03155 [Candidatus Woesebacteria bacterium]
MLQVIKRNSTIQNWDRQKMVTSMTNAGVTKVIAELITSLVYENVRDTGCQHISSATIRKMIIDVLRSVNNRSADVYEHFSKEISKN